MIIGAVRWCCWHDDSFLHVIVEDFGSDDEDNDFAEEEDEDGGSDYEEKKVKKGKKPKVEKPSKRTPKRKRVAGNDAVLLLRTC